MAALREKVPYDSVVDVDSPSEVAAPDRTPVEARAAGEGRPDAAVSAGDTSPTAVDADAPTEGTATDPAAAAGADGDGSESTVGDATESGAPPEAGVDTATQSSEATDDAATTESAPDAESEDDRVTAGDVEPADTTAEAADPETLPGHVRAVIGGETGRVRLLDDAFGTVDAGDAGAAFDLVEGAGDAPAAVVLDGALDQRLLDVAAQRGVCQVVAAATGEFVKQPTSVRVRTAEELLAANEA
jgi:hypothetical protein